MNYDIKMFKKKIKQAQINSHKINNNNLENGLSFHFHMKFNFMSTLKVNHFNNSHFNNINDKAKLYVIDKK